MKRTLLHSFYTAALLFASTLTFTSCDSSTENEGSISYADKGVFILNEGNFGTPNGTISFYHKGSGQVVNDIFSKSNDDQLLGDVLQSMQIHGERAFIVANNSNKLEIVNHKTFESVGVVQDLKQPRHFAALNENKGYVTEWVAYGSMGQVSVIDLENYTITKTITVGSMPEQLLISDGKLYVANSGGNTVSVINTATDAIENTIQVPDGPSEFVIAENGSIWLLSAGKVVYNDDWSAIDYTKTTAGSLSNFSDPLKGMQIITFPSNQSIPSNLAINGTGDKLYYNYQDKTYEYPISNGQLDSKVIIDRSFYGMAVDPETGNIYGSDENGFSGDGTVFIYSPAGEKIKEFRTGIAPNGFVFN